MDTSKVTRFEIIDHRKCEECEGEGWVIVPDENGDPEQTPCIDCQVRGIVGRTVIAYDKNLKLDIELQDDKRTLKVFISEKSDERE